MDFNKITKIIKSKNVLTEAGFIAAGICIAEDGTIADILTDLDNLPSLCQVVDVGELYVLPGLVDSHVHVNEPGRTDWEGFWTATRAAAAGGVTTIVDMPLNSIPPTTSVENLQEKIKSCHGKLHTDVAFWGGLIPSNVNNLLPLVEAGVVGFKCFLCPSGVEEFPHVSWNDVRMALQNVRGSDTVIAFHAECEIREGDGTEPADPADYATFLASRPDSFETTAVAEICKLCPEFGVRCHIVHASSSGVVKMVQQVKKNTAAQLSVETCYHYLTLNSETVPIGATTYKCCPPIRSKNNQDDLWSFIRNGDIDLVVSDHSPCPPLMKESSNFMSAWGGIASVQFGLSLLWTAGAPNGLSLEFISKLVSSGPAGLCRLHKKGSLAVGKDADIVVFNPNQLWTVTEEDIHHKHKITPYLGKTLRGRVMQTFLRGHTIYKLGEDFPLNFGKTILLKN